MADPNEQGGAQSPEQKSGAGGNEQQQQQQAGTPPDKGGSGGGAGGTGEKVYTYKEDRSDYIPRTRLNEESQKRQKIETELAELRSKFELSEKQKRILAGVESVDPKQAEAEEIRSAIYELVPELGALKGLTKDQLAQVLQAAEAAQNTSQATWERHATAMLTDLEAEACTGLGVDKLTPTQKRNLHRAYREEAAMALQARGPEGVDATGNDFLTRHERGDKALIKEFVKAYLDDWFEPARRSVTAANARRNMRPVPRGERTRLIPAQGEKKVDLTNDAEFKKALLEARASGQQ